MIGQTISHYRILEMLGRGGMGEVYLAEDNRLGRKIAIRFLSAEVATDERSRQRLLREAKTGCILDHPNIGAIDEAISAILTVDRRPRTDDR
jgi:serine/threonine protein kinase